MKSILFKLASVFAFVAVASAQFMINTPANVVVCQPLLLSWSGGTPPYFLSVLPGSQPSAPALQNLGEQTGTSFTWLVNLPVGTSIGFTLRDSTGAVAQTAPVTINAGVDTSCVGRTPSSSSTPSATATGTATTPRPATTTAPPAPGATTAPAPGGTTRPASSSSAAAATNAASNQVANIGIAGIFGAALVAVLS